jgi:alpha-L-fucosidase
MNASPRYTRSADPTWFQDSAFGLFVHFGIYSSAGIEASWPMKAFRSEDDTSGAADAWPPERYYALADQFTCEDYNPSAWAEAARAAGCRYAVLGAMHHDGFCLWPTRTKTFHSVNIGPRRDLVREYVTAFRAAGLKVGIYLSLIDWEDPDFVALPASVRFSSPVRPATFDPVRWNAFLGRKFEQVRELLTDYGHIDLLWFDVPGWGGDIWHADEMKMMMLTMQPHILCNDRLPGCGDFITPEQQIPLEPLDSIWETCLTTNENWGYHPDPSKYKSAKQLLRWLCEIRSLGGNLLLNVGPDARGRFPAPALDLLGEIGSWLERSGESIYGASRGLDAKYFWGPSTVKGDTLYCHLPGRPDSTFELRGIADDPIRVRLLQTGEDLPFRRESGRIVIDCGACHFDPLLSTVAVEFARPPAALCFTSTVFHTRGKPLWDAGS